MAKDLKRDSWHHKIYSFYYHWTPSSNGCAYFWNWVLLVFLGLPGLLGCIFYKATCNNYNFYRKNNIGIPPTAKALLWPFLSALLLIVSIALGVAASHLIANIVTFPNWWLTGLGWVAGGIAALMLLIGVSILLYESPFGTFMKDTSKTIKEDWCPTINWK